MIRLRSHCFSVFKPHPYLILDAWQIHQPLLVEPSLSWSTCRSFWWLPPKLPILIQVFVPKAQWKSHMVPLLGLGLQIFHGLRCPLALVEKASDRLRRRLWRCLYLVVRDGEQPVAGRKFCQLSMVVDMSRIWRQAQFFFRKMASCHPFHGFCLMAPSFLIGNQMLWR